jgi:hypothetical protein
VSPVTVAVTCANAFTGIGVVVGVVTLIVIPGTLKLADAAAVPLAAAVALMVTVKSPAGGIVGAV